MMQRDARKQGMLSSLAHFSIALLLASSGLVNGQQAELGHVRRITKEIKKLAFQYTGQPDVQGCGPDVVGEECEELVASYASLGKYPCPTRFDDIPVPAKPQLFFRCNGDVLTVEDCGSQYVFDPNARYCVLKKKVPTVAGDPKPPKKEDKPKNPSTTEKPPSSGSYSTPDPPICPNGFSSHLKGLSKPEGGILGACKKNQRCLRRLDDLRADQCKPNTTSQSPLTIMSAETTFKTTPKIKNDFVHEARFWWVPAIPLQLQWRSPSYAPTLQDCLLACNDRFVIVGAETCACGSIREEHRDFNVKDWIKAQDVGEVRENDGFLLHDREAFKAVEWSCAAKPAGWKKLPEQQMKDCMAACVKNQASYLAFGSDGCFCSPGRGDPDPLNSLPLDNCQRLTDGSEGYTVLDVRYWGGFVDRLLKKKNTNVIWGSVKPSNVIWKASPSRSIAYDCYPACTAVKGTRWIAMGAAGCECGTEGSAEEGTVDSMTFQNEAEKKSDVASRWFLLVKYTGDVQGFKPTDFKYAQETKITPTQLVTVNNVTEQSAGISAIESKMMQTASQYFKKLDYNTIRSNFAPENASTSLHQQFRTWTSTSENITETFENKTGDLVSQLEALQESRGFHLRKRVAADGYYGYDMSPYFQSRSLQDGAIFRSPKFSIKRSELSLAKYRAMSLGRGNGAHRREKESRGHLFFIKPTMYGRCLNGIANQTGWLSLGEKPDTLKKCFCACEDHVAQMGKNESEFLLSAVVMQSGKCYCSPSSEQLGNLITQVPKPASCPEGTMREAYKIPLSIRSKNTICQDFKESQDVKVAYPGDVGGYESITWYEHSHFSTLARSILSFLFKASNQEQRAMNSGNYTVVRHDKRGKTQRKERVSVRKDIFPRMFRIRMVRDCQSEWEELYQIGSHYEAMERSHVFTL